TEETLTRSGSFFLRWGPRVPRNTAPARPTVPFQDALSPQPPSSSGLGRRPLKAVTPVQIRSGVPHGEAPPHVRRGFPVFSLPASQVAQEAAPVPRSRVSGRVRARPPGTGPKSAARHWRGHSHGETSVGS